MPTSSEFRRTLQIAFAGANLQQLPHLDVNAGDLHRLVGDYPGPNNRMPVCCDVMYQEFADGDVILEAPPKGKGASLTIRYQIPRH